MKDDVKHFCLSFDVGQLLLHFISCRLARKVHNGYIETHFRKGNQTENATLFKFSVQYQGIERRTRGDYRVKQEVQNLCYSISSILSASPCTRTK